MFKLQYFCVYYLLVSLNRSFHTLWGVAKSYHSVPLSVDRRNMDVFMVIVGLISFEAQPIRLILFHNEKEKEVTAR